MGFIPSATNVFVTNEEISCRCPKSHVDLLASCEQLDPAT